MQEVIGRKILSKASSRQKARPYLKNNLKIKRDGSIV
jgi:hypothetical protein